MATKLFLRTTTENGLGGGKLDMVTTAGGSGTATAQVSTTAGATEKQWTESSGGATIEWISGRVPAGGFTLSGTMTFSIWAREDSMNANCGARARVFKRTAAGVESEIGGGPFDDGVEFGTGNGEFVWTGTPTSTSFAENDRIIVRFYITNIGTMGGGFSSLLTYAGPDGNQGDSFFQINEDVTFKAEPVITLDQTAYRLYEDGTESGATPLAAQNTGASVNSAGDPIVLVRVRLQESGGVAGASGDTYVLYYSHNGGAYSTLVDWVGITTEPVGYTDSTNLTHGNPTTNQLGAGSGSFAAGEIAETGVASGSAHPASGYTEHLFVVKLKALNVADGDTLDFRVRRNGAVLNAYTVTPRITVVEAADGNASGALGAQVTVTSMGGSASGVSNGDASGPLGADITISTLTGGAIGEAAAGGALQIITVSAFGGEAVGDAEAEGGFGSLVTVTALNGSAGVSADASGSFGTQVTITALGGGAGGDAAAGGALSTTTVTSLGGGATGDAAAGGTLSQITISAMTGTAGVSTIASGSLSTVTVTNLGGGAIGHAETGGSLTTVIVTGIGGGATGGAGATGALSTIVVTSLTGSVVGDAAAGGALQTVTLSALGGGAAGGAGASGSLQTVTLSALGGGATGDANTDGSLVTVTVTPMTGTASGEGASIASGPMGATVVVTELTGTASGEVNIEGSLTAVTLTSMSATASGNANVSAALSVVTLTALEGGAIGEANAGGTLTSTTITAMGGGASGSAEALASLASLQVTAMGATVSAEAFVDGPLSTVIVSPMGGSAATGGRPTAYALIIA